MKNRIQITNSEISFAVEEVQSWLWIRIKEKGRGSFISTHEVRGAIDEEFFELREAFGSKDKVAIAHELKDVIIGAIVGLACLRAGHLE